MDKKEFEKRLKEDKWFDKPEELIDYRLPVVQYFLTNYINSTTIFNSKIIESKIIESKNVIIKYNKNTDFTLVNEAFITIKKGLKL